MDRIGAEELHVGALGDRQREQLRRGEAGGRRRQADQHAAGVLADAALVRLQRHRALREDVRILDHRSVVDRKSTRLNSSHTVISYAVFCLKKKKKTKRRELKRITI